MKQRTGPAGQSGGRGREIDMRAFDADAPEARLAERAYHSAFMEIQRQTGENIAMQAKTLRANIMLLCGALIWGTAFAAQRMVSDTVEPYTFNAVRSYIGGAGAAARFLYSEKEAACAADGAQKKQARATLLRGGILCGLFLCAAATLQQFGITYTTAGKAGFITTLYIVLVPLFGMFLKKRTTAGAWIAVAVAAAGLYLLCVTEQFTIALGDIYVMLCAVFFSLHILCVDYFSPRGGRRAAKLPAVSRDGRHLHRARLCLRDAGPVRHPLLLGAHSLCGGDVQRRRLYAADPRAEGHQPGSSPPCS